MPCPVRMKGYGREFAPQYRADWEALVRDLLQEIEHMRQAVAPKDGLQLSTGAGAQSRKIVLSTDRHSLHT
jgi:hypothetical protein